jgi:L-ascorbate metabolism protein UlaG (beta-lactamase superfamily)
MKRTPALAFTLVLLIASAGLAGTLETLAEDSLATEAGPAAIHPVNHASFVLTWNDMAIYVDPVGGAEAYSTFPMADLVLVTHTHHDHLDPGTIAGIRTPKTHIVAPATVAEELGELDGLAVMANGEKSEWGGVGIEAIPMYNLTPERAGFHPQGDGNGYVLTLGGTRIYIAGDTEDIPEMRALKDIDAAFVCMNLPYTMDVEHAADAVREFKPKVVYPYHYRGKGGMSDIDLFAKLVGKDSGTEVRLLDWY